MSETAHINLTQNDSTIRITGGGALDLTNSGEFHDSLKNASLSAESVIVDLRPAVFIDTAIVQDLGRAAVTLLRRNRRLKVLVKETAYPLQVLQISGFKAIMDIEVEPDSSDVG